MLLPKKYQARIFANETLTPRAHKVTLELLEPKTIEFTPGQFLMYEIESGVKRAYSISTPPSQNSKIELLIDTEPGGPASQYFSQVTAGLGCQFMAPYGVFNVRNNANDKVFIAGSTGVAPIRAMIRAGLTLSETKWTLYFGVNHVDELFLVEEFRNLEKKFPNFKYIPVVATPEKEWNGEKDLVDEPVMRDLRVMGKMGVCDYYICGPPKMVHAVKQQLLDSKINQENIFTERY